ncbi:MAG: serine--tRNA ligase [Candidimonas sp.]|nr:MAG: serine--tRNA ligase [Candidimonas sp.]
MLDPNQLRKDLPAVVERLALRGVQFDTDRFGRLEARRKAVQVETEALQARRNALSRLVGQLKSGGRDASKELAESQVIPERLRQLELDLSRVQSELGEWLMTLPNLPHASVPPGLSSDDNVEVRRWIPPGMAVDARGCPRAFPFVTRDHVTLGEAFGLDFESARKLAGARFMMLRGPLARLHRALAQFMLDLQTGEHGYTECYTPYIVNGSTLLGTGQLPKFRDDMFWVTKGGEDEEGEESPQQDAGRGGAKEELYLISTAEVTLVGSMRDSIIPERDLPVKLTAHTPCFRSEAGSGGRDVRGIIRQHQFDKVEMVQATLPEKSYDTLEEMVRHAETVLQRLGVPYRVVLLCGGDMGFGAAKTYDLEVWLPAQDTWREISSVSNCEAFQARRMHARYRPESGKPAYVHTLNGSGLAVGRALVAVLENCQREDGSVVVPDVLRPYMGGVSVLAPQR